MDESLKKIRPLGDRILIEKIEEKERKVGSIFLPQNANEIDTSWTAKVVAVGIGRRLENGTVVPPDVSPGDIILIGKYMGAEVKVDDLKYYAVHQDDVLAVVES